MDGHQLGPSALGAQERLDSWKEIAVYLHRSERSVRRWEKQERLPVHRHMHGKSGSVYAYREELDRWWISNDHPEPASGVSEPRRATAASTPRSDPSAVPRHIYCDSIYACIEEFNNRQSKRESELSNRKSVEKIARVSARTRTRSLPSIFE